MAATGVEKEQASEGFDCQLAVTFDQIIDAVSDLLPVNRVQYPDLPEQPGGNAVQFCLRHSALHFSKTAGRLAAFVEDADHGSFQKIEKLEGIVAAGLINSFKLADEIGLSGSRLVESIRLRWSNTAKRHHERSLSRALVIGLVPEDACVRRKLLFHARRIPRSSSPFISMSATWMMPSSGSFRCQSYSGTRLHP